MSAPGTTQRARILYEDALVARARGQWATVRHRGVGVFRRREVPAVAAHRDHLASAEQAFTDAGGLDALGVADRNLARRVARARLSGDKQAGRCLCGLRGCGEPLDAVKGSRS